MMCSLARKLKREGCDVSRASDHTTAGQARNALPPPLPGRGQVMWSPFTGAKTPYKDHPEDVGTHVLDAYALLCNANRRGIQVPSDVVSTITQARAAAKAGTLEGELETKFWNAYGLRSWRRPLPPASVRHKNTSRSKDQEVQWLRRCPLQRLYKFILDHDKIFHSCNYLIFLLFL